MIATVVAAAPGLGTVRARFADASPGWLTLAVVLELASVVSYVVIFRSVFCPRMRWRLTSQVALSEQAANSLLPVSGAGGLALGAWALRREGMNVEQIGRKTVAFFFLTSLANVGLVIVFAVLYAAGVLGHDPNTTITYLFGALAVAAILGVLALPRLVRGASRAQTVAPDAGRVARSIELIRSSVVSGVPDAVLLVRRRSMGVLLGSFGTTVFDIAVLAATFRAIGVSPPIGALVLGYLIGMLGGNVPVPGGIGGLDAGLIGILVLYREPLGATTVAVLAYHAIALWVPALVGSAAFVGLRATLRRNERAAAMCTPLAESLEGQPLASTA